MPTNAPVIVVAFTVENVPAAGVFAPIIVPSIAPPLISIFENVEPDDVISPVTLPVKLPSNIPATNVSAPTDHLSVVSFHNKNLLSEVPRSISIPTSSDGAPVKSPLIKSFGSAKLV